MTDIVTDTSTVDSSRLLALAGRFRGKRVAVIGDLVADEFVYGRVARLLLDLATEENGKLMVPEKLTQQDIASRVGCSREMISRIFKDLRTGGYIEMEGERMVIAKKPPRAW